MSRRGKVEREQVSHEYRKARAAYVLKMMKGVDTSALTSVELRSTKNRFRREYSRIQAKKGVPDAARIVKVGLEGDRSRRRNKEKKLSAETKRVKEEVYERDVDDGEAEVESLSGDEAGRDFWLTSEFGGDLENSPAAAFVGYKHDIYHEGYDESGIYTPVIDPDKLLLESPGLSLIGDKEADSVVPSPNKKQRNLK